MATRFLRYDSDPILRKKCKAVLKVDDKIRQLLDDMLDTLHETENGAALAANQVGVLKRLVVIDFNDTRLNVNFGNRATPARIFSHAFTAEQPHCHGGQPQG